MTPLGYVGNGGPVWRMWNTFLDGKTTHGRFIPVVTYAKSLIVQKFTHLCRLTNASKIKRNQRF